MLVFVIGVGLHRATVLRSKTDIMWFGTEYSVARVFCSVAVTSDPNADDDSATKWVGSAQRQLETGERYAVLPVLWFAGGSRNVRWRTLPRLSRFLPDKCDAFE